MASFLSNLSWHDDNKIQMYQASEEVTIELDFDFSLIIRTRIQCCKFVFARSFFQRSQTSLYDFEIHFSREQSDSYSGCEWFAP